MAELTASKKAKELGLKSLTQVSELTKQSPQTLTNWFNAKPELFNIVLLGCVSIVSDKQTNSDNKGERVNEYINNVVPFRINWCLYY